MIHHVLAFGSSALDSSGGDVQLPAVAEQCFTLDSSNNFLIPKPMQILLGYVGAVGLTRARFRTGSLLARGLPQFYPINLTVLPPTPVQLMDLTKFPIKIRKEESLRVETTTAAAVAQAACLWVTEGPFDENVNIPELRWIRATASIVQVQNAWSAPVALAFQDTLEGGSYDIYGMAVDAAHGVAARLILQGEFYRPGCLCQALNTAVPDRFFDGRLGKWASFSAYSPPQIESLGSGAATDTAQIFLLCGKSS